jgi:hypothetical protein
MTKSILAWHFVGKKLRDGRPIPRDGVTLKFNGTPILCKQGLHASIEPFDALQYAPGDTLCRARCGGVIIKDKDKLVCTERTIIARMDASEMLRYFARMRALSVIHDYPNGTDDIVFSWLMTGEESIRSAADLAAHSAARSAVYSAAYSAAYSVADSAARAASSAAHWAADWAADSARCSVACSAARKEFNALVSECFENVKC